MPYVVLSRAVGAVSLQWMTSSKSSACTVFKNANQKEKGLFYDMLEENKIDCSFLIIAVPVEWLYLY